MIKYLIVIVAVFGFAVPCQALGKTQKEQHLQELKDINISDSCIQDIDRAYRYAAGFIISHWDSHKPYENIKLVQQGVFNAVSCFGNERDRKTLADKLVHTTLQEAFGCEEAEDHDLCVSRLNELQNYASIGHYEHSIARTIENIFSGLLMMLLSVFS